MLIYVHRPEGNLGPYSREDLYNLVMNGTVGADELAWYEGLAEWVPVKKILPPVARVSAANEDPPPSPNAAAEFTRNNYLPHEASVRSLAWLYYLGGALTFFPGICVAGSALMKLQDTPAPSTAVLINAAIISGILITLGVLQIWLANQYRHLRPSAVVPGTILAAIGLLGIPLGTLINGYILYLLHCEKGKAIFSDGYQAVVEATPEIRCHTSLLVKILVGLLAVLLVLALIGLALSALSHSAAPSRPIR